jgi:hypothetical protein
MRWVKQTKITDHLSFDLDASSQDAMDGMPFGGRIELGPYTCIILSQDE